MDGQRFDRLTMRLARAGSRRQVVKGIGGGLTAAVLGLAGRGASAQTCRQNGKLCTKNANCCSNFCDTANPDPFKRNRCACPPNTIVCGNACCAGVPNGTPVCVEGTCGIQCDGQADLCGGVCCADDQFCQQETSCVACLVNGTECADDNQCCSGICNIYFDQCTQCPGASDPCGDDCCEVNEFCDGQSCVPCREDNAPCSDDEECCSGACNTYTGQCIPFD